MRKLGGLVLWYRLQVHTFDQAVLLLWWAWWCRVVLTTAWLL